MEEKIHKNSIILLFVALFFLVSCSSSHSSNNSNIIPDSDDSETIADDDTDSEQDSDFIDGSDGTPDQDADSDSVTDECQPPLSEAQFPYYDANGKITFCRPNCDTPTADDPICIGNLWDKQNDALCHEYPEYACCGTPCVMESLTPMTKEELNTQYPTVNIPMHKCDLLIGQVNWGLDGSGGVVKSWNMSDGKIGFHMYPVKVNYQQYPSKRKYFTYDIATKKYSIIILYNGRGKKMRKGFNNNKYVKIQSKKIKERIKMFFFIIISFGLQSSQ